MTTDYTSSCSFDLGYSDTTSCPDQSTLTSCSDLISQINQSVVLQLEEAITSAETLVVTLTTGILGQIESQIQAIESVIDSILTQVSDKHATCDCPPQETIFVLLPLWAQQSLTNLGKCPPGYHLSGDAFARAPEGGTQPEESYSGGLVTEGGPGGGVGFPVPSELSRILSAILQAITGATAGLGTPPPPAGGPTLVTPAVPQAGTVAPMCIPDGAAARDGGTGEGTMPPPPPPKLLTLIELSAQEPLPEPGEIDYPAAEGTPAPTDQAPVELPVTDLPPVPPPPWE